MGKSPTINRAVPSRKSSPQKEQNPNRKTVSELLYFISITFLFRFKVHGHADPGSR